MISDPDKFRAPRFIADASVVAFGGEFTDMQMQAGVPHEALCPSLPIQGASCALAPNGGRTVVERFNAVTHFRGLEIVRAGSLYAEARLDLQPGVATTTTIGVVSQLKMGRAGLFALDLASAQMVSQRPMDPNAPSRFKLAQPVLTGLGFEVVFLPVDEIPETYQDAAEEVRREALFRKACAGRRNHGIDGTRAFFADSTEAKPPIVLRLVDHIEIPGGRGTLVGSNGVHIPDFGQVYFGELIIREHSRVFSLMRMELGCPEHGSGGGPIIRSNGEPTTMSP